MLRHKDLVNYVLGILYEIKKQGRTGYYSLKTILEKLNYSVSISDMYGIGKYLEAEGFVKAERQIGDIFIKITTDGILYVENKSIIENLERFLNSSTDYTSILEMSLANIRTSRKPVLEKIKNAREKISETVKVSEVDILKDLDILNMELDKDIPDREIVFIKMNELKKYEGVAFEIRELFDMIDTY